MDAAQKLIKNIALFLTMALLVVVPARSQSPFTASPNPVALNGTTTYVTVTVSGSGNFTIATTGTFFDIYGGQTTGTGGGSFTVEATQVAGCAVNACNGSITLHPTSATDTTEDLTIPVTFTPGQGTGSSGVISASPNPVVFNAATGQALSTMVTLTTNSQTAVSFTFTTTPSNGSSWLSVSENSSTVSPGSSSTVLNVYVNATNFTTQQTGSITITPGNGQAQTVIPVTMNVNGSSSSTYTVGQTNVSLAYPGNQSQFITVSSSNSSVTTFDAYVNNCNNVDFLLVNNSTSVFNQNVGNGLNLTLNNPGSLLTNVYTCQAVVYNPNNSNDAVTISVTLTVNGGGSSGGGFTLSPSSLTLTSAYGSTSTQNNYITVTSSTGQTAYNATFTSQSSPNGNTNWITMNGSTLTTISGQAVANGMNIALNNPQSLAAGSYSGYVSVSNGSSSGAATLYISLTVTSGGSNGSSYTVSQTSFNFQSPCGTCSGSVTVSSSSQSQFTATTSSSGGAGNWLTVGQSGYYPGTQITGYTSLPLSIFFQSGLAPTGTGTYSGQVVISNPNNSNDSVTIYIYLAVNGGGSSGGASASPTTLTFNTPVGVVPAQQSVYVTVPSSNPNFTASISASNGYVFLTSPCNCTYSGSQSLGVAVNPGSLGAGTYYNYINLASGGTTFASVTVTLSVGSGSGTTSGVAAPTSLSFYYETGQSSPPAQIVSIGASGYFTATPNQSWIALNVTSGYGPANLTVSVIPQQFSAGTSNTGSIYITTPSGGQTVSVSLSVTSGMDLYAYPGTISLTTPTYTSVLQISASDNSTQAVNATTQTSWITLSNPTNDGNTPASYLVTVNPAGLCNGLNTGSITATTSGAANSPLTIPVTVLITGSTVTNCSSSTGPLTLSASSLTFAGALYGSAPPTQVLTVTAPSSSTLYTVSTSVQQGNWLSVTSPCTYCYGSQGLVVSVNQSGLNAGTYQGTITLNTSGVVQQVGVTLNVGTSGASGTITASSTSMTFSAPVGGAAPAAQSVQFTSSASGVGYILTFTPTNSWLSVSNNGSTVSSGQGLTTPSTSFSLSVSVNPANLAASATPYTGSITISPNGGSAVTISVSLTVQNNVVSASPSSLTFTYQAGDTAPAAQTVQVTSGTAGLAFSAQVSAGNCASGWLAASPATGTTQGTVSVSVNPGSVGVGTCNGTVTIAGTGSATGSTTVSVTLTVTAPVLTITQVSSAASYLGSSISPGEIITIFGTNLGPTPYVTLALDNTGKVATTLCPPLQSGTTCSASLGVQVLVAGFLAPIVFASNTQVSAVVPYEVAQLHGSQPVEVKFLGQASNAIGVQISPTAPGIFTANASGTGPGAISNQNYSANSPSNPAAKGSVVAIYLTGEGLTTPSAATGSVTTTSLPAPQVTPAPLLPVGVLIDGQPVTIAYAGEAPGIVAGVMQLNVVIPAGARTGDLPLVVSIGGTSSQSGVTVSVH